MARNIASTLRKLGKGPAVDYEQQEAQRAPRTDREREDDQSEHDRYRRKQRRMAEQDTATSLPIKVVNKKDREKESAPKPGTVFEGPVEKLIEKYKDPREVVRHMTTGQFMKYELRGGQIWQNNELIYDGTEFMKD